MQLPIDRPRRLLCYSERQTNYQKEMDLLDDDGIQSDSMLNTDVNNITAAGGGRSGVANFLI